MEAITRCRPPACQAEMHAGSIDHHTDATVGTDVGHSKRQHAKMQPRRRFHVNGPCAMIGGGILERHAKSRPRPHRRNKRGEHERPKGFDPWTNTLRQLRPTEFDPWPRVFNLWNPRWDTDKLKTCRHRGQGHGQVKNLPPPSPRATQTPRARAVRQSSPRAPPTHEAAAAPRPHPAGAASSRGSPPPPRHGGPD